MNWKNDIPLWIALTFCPVITWAQDNRFDLRTHAGIVASQVDGDRFGGYHKAGVELGIGTLYQGESPWQWGLSLLYAQKGSLKGPNQEAGDLTKFVIALHYLSFPFHLRYSFAQQPWYLECGPEFGYLIRGLEKDASGPLNNRPEFNRWLLDSDFAIGYRLKALELSLRWSYSLMPIRRIPGPDRRYDSSDHQFNKLFRVRISLYLSGQK